MSRAELRDWLNRHAGSSPGIWLITYKKDSGQPFPTYDDIVEEALCFGWIDSTRRGRDADTSMLLLTPRKPTSMWSAVNKKRLEHLLPSGLMTERGLRAIEVAKANGSWTLLDSVDRLEVPDDLAAALAGRPGADEVWESFPPSAKKQALWWVISAKRAATRQRRIDVVAEGAAQGKRGWQG